MDTEKNVWDRVRTFAPTSVVTPTQEEGRHFVERFYDTYRNEMQQRHILPMTISCGQYQSAVAFWHALAGKCCEAIAPLTNDDNRKNVERLKLQIDKATTTDPIKVFLVKILNDEIKKKTGWNMLVAMEDFDALVEYSSSSDLMKIRQLIELPVVIMAVSRKSLIDLCTEKYGNPYFSNQFERFNYTTTNDG
ncbi:MAG: hypothetical protein IJ841_05360 [Prevotella sp.]|nr:hypothetical protein [Prevotella sp.]